MGRPATVVPAIKRVLEPYLERALADYEGKPEPRVPTLPATSDGKVNVAALTAALKLPPSQQQHFFKNDELKTLVNVVAKVQGLALIGSRADQSEEDAAARRQIARAEKKASGYQQELAEREALIEQQRRRIMQLEEILRIQDSTGLTMRTEPIK